ncbi:uncharacterized protein N0V89_004056 [Didymosphaeria variabile]|uniref:Uncharacterized protein n=1 Tax=Didymosphaeria variabile TaxID=1932322 RepID=A0A9W8XP74_9PLEO|nr:uncharacterized protein N0V89_004056 [Didymosphaeria variabile]KAJ4356029.1 hypothetical protein N0V89_004056 [Didymosphaeria variabile]
MKVITGLLSRFKPKTFKISYAPEYKTFLQHHAVGDPLHPMHILRRREMEARKREGLWWHVTTGVDLSKSGVVRSWCRRRLRNAFTEGLKERGFDEFGRLMNAAALPEYRRLERTSERNEDWSLTGSVRLHIAPALVTARYADMREETDAVVAILLEGVKADMFSSHHSIPPPKPTRPQSRTFSQSRIPSRSKPLEQAESQVQPKTYSRQEVLSQFELPSPLRAPLSNIRFQSTPSTPIPQMKPAVRKTMQSNGSWKSRWHGWDSH